MRFALRVAATLLAGLGMCGSPRSGFAQPESVVQWTAVFNVKESALDLFATLQEGWHVYAATQLPGGPTPLQVTLEVGADAQFAGVASGTAPQKRHDASFDLDTEFYSHDFTVRRPVIWHAPRALADSLPVVVRYQTCSDRECQPPRTIRLSVPTSGPEPK